jgi:hypothetical protein
MLYRRRSPTCTAAKHACPPPTLPRLITLITSPPANRLRLLRLSINIIGTMLAFREAVVAAIVARALHVYYDPMHQPNTPFMLRSPLTHLNLASLGYVAIVAADDNIANEFRKLRHLYALQTLTVRGALFFMDADGWCASLCGMPGVQRLAIRRCCTVSRDALVKAGEECRNLRAAEFYSCVDFAMALDYEASGAAIDWRQLGWVLFPELRSVHRLLTRYKK